MSSVKDEGDNYVLPLGRTVRETAALPETFDRAHRPGAFFRYSNLNYPLIGSVLEKATGERFDRLMSKLVLQPLGLDACFNYTTCSDAKLARMVVLYRPDGSVARDDLRGRRPDCPVATTGPACELENYERGTFFSSGRSAGIDDRPGDDRADVAEQGASSRPPVPEPGQRGRRPATALDI
jgi:CubicO group peptidase (beta-lactamase class C family)